MKEQIEEMTKIIARRSKAFRNPNVAFMTTATKTAESLYNAGYRKKKEGEWIDQYQGMYVNQLYKCSVCGETAFHDDKRWFLTKFCPNCGAHMRGGKNE